MSERVRLTVIRPAPSEVRVVPLPVGTVLDGMPAREALVVLDDTGAVRAFANVCQHVPIPLDAGSRRFLDEEGFLVCATHGALYRRSDGLCVQGPCRGRSLSPVAVVEHGDELELVLPTPSTT